MIVGDSGVVPRARESPITHIKRCCGLSALAGQRISRQNILREAKEDHVRIPGRKGLCRDGNNICWRGEGCAFVWIGGRI